MGAPGYGRGFRVLDIRNTDPRRDGSAMQEMNSIRRVQARCHFGELVQGSHQAAHIGGWYGFFVDENHAAVISACFRPIFQQRRDRPAIVADQRQAALGRRSQASGIAPPEKRTAREANRPPTLLSSERRVHGFAGADPQTRAARYAHRAAALACQRLNLLPAANSMVWGNMRFSVSKTAASFSASACSISSAKASA